MNVPSLTFSSALSSMHGNNVRSHSKVKIWTDEFIMINFILTHIAFPILQFSIKSKYMLRYDTIGRIELIPSIVLSSDNTNYKNIIQLFLQLFDELSVYRDCH